MKVRITENKIRLRLKEPEVQALHDGSSINEMLRFGPSADQQLLFCLESNELSGLDLTYQPGRVAINLPKSFAETLATTTKVGYEGKVVTGLDSSILLLIEKDFECLDAPEEDNAGSYPNPKSSC
jgi:hypothetical protein